MNVTRKVKFKSYRSGEPIYIETHDGIIEIHREDARTLRVELPEGLRICKTEGQIFNRPEAFFRRGEESRLLPNFELLAPRSGKDGFEKLEHPTVFTLKMETHNGRDSQCSQLDEVARDHGSGLGSDTVDDPAGSAGRQQ